METLVFSLQPVADMLMRPLEAEARREAALAPACCYDAIVVLGGGVAPAAPPELPDPNLTDGSDRVWLAARLYKRGAAKRIIVSGGSLLNQPPEMATSEAEAMRRFLLDLGVPDGAIVSEGGSRNTIENIRNVRRMVGDAPVALVTSAFHMPRAMRIARQAGLNAAAFPTDWSYPVAIRPVWENWVPSADAMGGSIVSLRENLALMFDHRGVR
jgi:uncharacterized SAM-binding protein YcdF (DUF218 family)